MQNVSENGQDEKLPSEKQALSVLQEDQIDRIVTLWKSARPDLALNSTEVIGRIVRLEYFITRRVLQDLAHYDLNVGEFDVLAALRRHPPSFQLSPNQLQTMVLISSGALTNRINRLESRGLVNRTQAEHDRRGVIVTLTEQGFKVIEEAVKHHLAAESELANTLSDDEQRQIAALLKKMLLVIED
ncbi:MarR family winged helix-turn-helix transcriptional regulator [Oceanisphaera pacifica]|uniref:MarR family transcriptional regulator n=1 Tax=Oceanisphaera pacifica TaxID=2818389 RepID=A0ABS3NHT8_9GAMM|nr:MarR family transcriptional regulator [Oceanisphaera pacifica]MBO1520154.1 MarR family transcriptional regulator [Oceanisphaera pacifica]